MEKQEKEHMRVTVDNVIEEVNGKLFVIVIVIDVLTELKHRVTILFVLIFLALSLYFRRRRLLDELHTCVHYKIH